MPYFTFRTAQTHAIVEAPHWLAALEEALPDLGVRREDLPRIIVRGAPHGVIYVTDPWNRVQIAARAGADSDLPAPGEERQAAYDTPERDIAPANEKLEAVLFLKSEGIASADNPEAAAAAALDLLSKVVPSASGAVLVAGPDHEGFAFVGARGPAADRVRGKVIPFESRGIVGHVHDTGVAVRAFDLDRDARHLHQVDDVTGYHPRNLLAVPIRDDAAHAWGVIELLDGDFPGDQIEFAEEVALFLANYLTAWYGDAA